MPWKASSVMEERLRFVARLLDGEAMTEVCREFGISRKTGYKILDRYKEHGLEALGDRSMASTVTNLSYSVFFTLPDGLTITPLPSSLVLLASAIGLAGACWRIARGKRTRGLKLARCCQGG